MAAAPEQSYSSDTASLKHTESGQYAVTRGRSPALSVLFLTLLLLPGLVADGRAELQSGPIG